MWWLIPIGVAVGIKLIYDAVSEEERSARKSWESKRYEVEKSIEEHRRNIERHLAQAQGSYDFHFLTDLHYSSVKVADAAYKLLKDARSSHSGMSKMLIKAKEQKGELEKQLQDSRRRKDTASTHDAIEQLKIVKDLRQAVFDDRDKVDAQMTSFSAEVKRLNAQTNNLKSFIRDRCGEKGMTWYRRLEERKKIRRESEAGR